MGRYLPFFAQSLTSATPLATDVAENPKEMHSWKRGIVRGDGGAPGGHNPNPDLRLMANDHVLRYFPYK
jgi:hypothetical protein